MKMEKLIDDLLNDQPVFDGARMWDFDDVQGLVDQHNWSEYRAASRIAASIIGSINNYEAQMIMQTKAYFEGVRK